MAVYKVPQDVEAEDKLIGPFGFRQFIYLLVAAGAGGLTFLFFKAPMPIPLFSVFSIPVGAALIILALPLRKDQPMEIYLAAVLRFMLKPKRRIWMNDGAPVGLTIDVPAVIQRQLSRNLSQEQALNQLNYLSRIVDSHGWAAKGVDMPGQTYVSPALASAASSANDIMDEDAVVARSFDALLAKQKEQSHQAALEMMRGGQVAAPAAPANYPQPQPAAANTAAAPAQPASAPAPSFPQGDQHPAAADKPHFNPYPSMRQHVLSPLDRLQANTFHAPGQADKQASRLENDSGKIQGAEDMTPHLSPDIMRLANNKDLSIQTIANEAHRAQQREQDEVVIKLH